MHKYFGVLFRWITFGYLNEFIGGYSILVEEFKSKVEAEQMSITS